MIQVKEKDNYKDLTKEWIKSKRSYGRIENANYVILNNQIFYVDKKNKIIHKNNEIEIAQLIVKTFGGVLKFLPDISEQDGVRCGDCLFRGEVWDIKELGKQSSSCTRAIDNLIKSAKGQSKNFIIDITDSKINRNILLKQIQNIYYTKGREWIDKIIVFDNQKLLKVYKKEVDTLSKQ